MVRNGNKPMSSQEIEVFARRIRRRVLTMTSRAKASHVGSCLSLAEIMAVLYGGILNVDPARPDWSKRDRFILSKGHAAACLYAALADCGYFPLEWLDAYGKDGSPLCGHVSVHGIPGADYSTGSLGHGLSVASGMALAGKRTNGEYRVFVALSDGECDEGSVWESAMFASHHELQNLVAIVDYNKIQSLDLVERTLRLEPFADKWRSFGWAVREVDGHDVSALRQALTTVANQPMCILAHTIKGKGVSFMENSVLWHYRSASPEELAKALEEVGADA